MLTHNFRASVDFKKVKNMEQIKITGTGTALILDRVNRIFAISGGLTMQWDFISDFKKIDDEPSLDEDGELFETAYDLVLEAKPKTKINLTSSYFAKEHKKDTDEIIKVSMWLKTSQLAQSTRRVFIGAMLLSIYYGTTQKMVSKTLKKHGRTLIG